MSRQIYLVDDFEALQLFLFKVKNQGNLFCTMILTQLLANKLKPNQPKLGHGKRKLLFDDTK